jgi:hypothetical protein
VQAFDEPGRSVEIEGLLNRAPIFGSKDDKVGPLLPADLQNLVVGDCPVDLLLEILLKLVGAQLVHRHLVTNVEQDGTGVNEQSP